MLALDLGGTRLKAAVVERGRAGEVLATEHDGTLAGARDAVARAMAALGATAPAALCVPGLVDDGRVVALPGKLDGIVGADLGELLCLPGLLVVNDAIAYAVGEAVHGAGAGCARVVVVTIGTGVGTAVVEGGRPLGAGRLGGGLLGGQVPIADPAEGPRDTSGRQGSFEAWCRAERVVAEARAAGADVADVPAALAAAARGDVAAAAGLAAYRSWLVQGLVAMAMAHAPDAIVVGGGPLSESDVLLEGVDAAVQGRLWAGQRCAVRRAALGDAAALLGLATLATGGAT